MITGGGDIQATASSSGVSLIDTARKPKLFKITSGTNPYAAVEVYLDGATGTVANYTGITISPASLNMLWELRGITTVPANTYVIAHPNPVADGWVFLYEDNTSDEITVGNTPTAGTGTADHTTNTIRAAGRGSSRSPATGCRRRTRKSAW